jgi:hypothetical protein
MNYLQIGRLDALHAAQGAAAFTLPQISVTLALRWCHLLLPTARGDLLFVTIRARC